MIVCCNPASVRWSCSLIAGFCITASQLIKKHATMHTLRAAEHKAPSSIIGSANECTNRYRCQAAGLQLHTGNKNESPVGKTATGFSKFEFNNSHKLLKPCTVGAQLVRVVAALQLSFLLLAAHI
jgi:hypothetical protein